MENHNSFERFKNQLLEVVAYSDIKTFQKFCAEHTEELKELRRQLSAQVQKEKGTPEDKSVL